MDSQHYFNPYSDKTFLGFFVEIFYRLWQFITGHLSFHDIASDEIQIMVLGGVAASCGLVGTFLVLRKMTMLANSLSHTILLGIVIAFLWARYGGEKDHGQVVSIEILLLSALVMGMITTFLTEFLTKVARLQEDASTGLVFTSLFAMGIILLTALTRNAHIGTEAVMGNVDALQIEDCKLVFTVLSINVILFWLFFKEFKITAFDAGLSKALGISPIFFGYLLMAQVSTTSIGAFRAVGVLLVLAFITGPPLAARLLTDSLKIMMLYSVIIGVTASCVGVAISRHMLTVYGLSLSTSGIVVCVITVIYIVIVSGGEVYRGGRNWRHNRGRGHNRRER